ncbi:AI-2E family transporter [uncultured Zhongshania sp.]|uniref:AI-2E family transporter n=1 Tax=uncultured Zhongshania sp. TaxID=1642288 RepID=UPI002601575E|nr:AI-2E family transporter [uncultured Zhongshania sp.]
MDTKLNNKSDWAIKILAILAVLYTLQVARDVMLPITLALIFALLLAPAVSRLQRIGVPRSIGATIIMAIGLSAIGGGVYALASPASDWLQRVPEAVDVLRDQLNDVNTDKGSVDAASRSIDSLANEFSSNASDPQITQVVIADAGWRTELGEIAKNFGVYGTLSIILLFFLLTSGEALMKRFIHSLPTQRDKAVVTRIAELAQTQMSRYLMTITAVNIAVGAITALGLWLAGFPDPALWGAVASLLRYIPYLGVSITIILFTIVSAVSYSNPAAILAAPLSYGLFTAFTGQFIDPFVHGLRFSLNPIVVFLWIFFWGWLWGAPGVLLAVPLLTLFQVVCQHTERLLPVAHIIGDTNE